MRVQLHQATWRLSCLDDAAPAAEGFRDESSEGTGRELPRQPRGCLFRPLWAANVILGRSGSCGLYVIIAVEKLASGLGPGRPAWLCHSDFVSH